MSQNAFGFVRETGARKKNRHLGDNSPGARADLEKGLRGMGSSNPLQTKSIECSRNRWTMPRPYSGFEPGLRSSQLCGKLVPQGAHLSTQLPDTKSEMKLCAELDFSSRSSGKDSQVIGCALGNARGATQVRKATLCSSTGRREIHPVEEIEGLDSNFQALRLREFEIL